jgi:diguanylate cyclase (GGDEF)-like protein
VELRLSDGSVIIFDCGTGARLLGQQLLKEEIRRIHLLIGHTHWDHIQGFPFFTPAALADCELNIYAPVGFQQSLEDALSGQMQYSYFPVKLQELSSRIHFTELEEGVFRIGEVLVETQYLNHTAPTIAYRVSHRGSTLAYVTDHEPFWNPPNSQFHHPGDQRHVDFLREADLVIHDAQYTAEEYSSKRGWGHSTIDYATDVAIAAGARMLALFHHDPSHDDETIGRLEEQARRRATDAGSPLHVFAAIEGISIELSESGTGASTTRETALDRRPIRGSRVLIITAQASDSTEIERTLLEDDLLVDIAGNGQAALAQAAEFRPDLIILDSLLPEGDGSRFVEPLRERAGKPDLPILVLTRKQQEERLDGATVLATDYLPHPYSSPMLRSRVRVWLARTQAANPEETGVLPRQVSAVWRTGRESLSAAEAVSIVELFRTLSPDQMEKVLAGSTQRQFPHGYSIINRGERGRSVYVILSGRVRISESLPDQSAEMHVAELLPGEVFGELGVLQEHIRSTSAIALERSACLVIPHNVFMETVRASSDLALSLVRGMSRRLLDADRTLARYGPDPLTGLPSRRAFLELYKRISAGVRRRGASVIVLVVDVVRLKAINDRHGYETGDAVLRAVAETLMECSRGTDLIARYGNDEFAALFVEAGAEHVDIIAGRIHEKFRSILMQRELPSDAQLRVGSAVGDRPPDMADELLSAALSGMQSHSGTPTGG